MIDKFKFKPFINTIFIHIPKTAGWSLYDYVFDLDVFFSWYLGVKLTKEDTTITNPEEYKSITIGHIYYKSLLDEKYMSIDYYDKAFKFCFVRNPYDRIVSLYKYHNVEKILKLDFDTFIELLYNEFKLKRVPPVGLYNIKTFHEDSPLYHEKITGNQYNEMIKWIPPDIGYIGRFENYEQNVNELLIILGYVGKPIKIPKLNASKGESDYKIYYKKPMTIKYVKAIYIHDIRRFGYKF